MADATPSQWGEDWGRPTGRDSPTRSPLLPRDARTAGWQYRSNHPRPERHARQAGWPAAQPRWQSHPPPAPLGHADPQHMKLAASNPAASIPPFAVAESWHPAAAAAEHQAWNGRQRRAVEPPNSNRRPAGGSVRGERAEHKALREEQLLPRSPSHPHALQKAQGGCLPPPSAPGEPRQGFPAPASREWCGARRAADGPARSPRRSLLWGRPAALRLVDP